MKNVVIPIILFVLSLARLSSAQSFALKDGEINTITNGVFIGNIVIENGKISAVGKDILIPDSLETIDCKGLRIYPGLIDAGSFLGLIEIGSLPETRDNAEVGEFNPDLLAFTAINPNSVLIPVARVNGVTSVISEPSSGLFPGQSTLINLFGYTPDEMAILKSAGMHLNFPSKGRTSSFDKSKLEEREKKYKEEMKKLNELWIMAENYYKNYKKAFEENKLDSFPINLQFQAFVPLFDEQLPLIIHVNSQYDILQAIEWLSNKKIKKIFSGVSEGWRVADDIAKSGIPCLVGPVLALPTRAEDRFDVPYKNVERLRKAGVKVAFRSGESSNVRNLPYEAATAVAYGMPEDEALKALTINPAEIFGVSDKYGSIENGKVANLVVTNGNILQVRTKILHLFINGHKVSLKNRQSELYDEFKKRNP